MCASQARCNSIQHAVIVTSTSEVVPKREGPMPMFQEIEEIMPGQRSAEGAIDPDDVHQAALLDNPSTAPKPSLATILSILFLGQALVAPVAVGFIGVTGILTEIGSSLNNLTDISWIVSGWSIASSVSTSLGGSLQDIFGRRYVILAGEFICLIGAIVAATAQTLHSVIAGSTILGLGCGFLSPYAAVLELVPNRYRAIAISWVEFSITFPWGAMGVLIGNLFVLHASWRWVYYVSTIYAAVVLVGTAMFYFPPARPMMDYDRTRWQQFLRLDFFGYTLYIASVTTLLLGLSWAGTTGHAWHSASVVAPIVLGVLGLIATFLYDFLIFQDIGRPIFPKDLFQQYREYTVSLVGVFVAGMVYFSMSGLLPQATLYVYTSDPIRLGTLLLPYGFGQVLTGSFVPLFIHRTKNPKIYLMTSLAIQTLFTALYAYGIDFHCAAFVAFMFFGQGCFSLITVATNVNVSLHVKASELGIATGLLGTFRSIGGGVGNVIFNAILQNSLNQHLEPNVAAAAMSHGYKGSIPKLIEATISAAVGVPDAFLSVEGATSAIERAAGLALKQTYAQAFRMVFYSTIPFGIVALIATFFIKDGSEWMTNHVQVYLVKDVLKKSSIVAEEHQISDEVKQ